MQISKLFAFTVVALLVSVVFAGLVAIPAAAQDETLGQALDNQNLQWSSSYTKAAFCDIGTKPVWQDLSTSGPGGWHRDSSMWYAGGSAAGTSAITDGNSAHWLFPSTQTYLTTVVNGPGTLSFYWKYSSYSWGGNGPAIGSVSFYVDGGLKKDIEGMNINTDWTRVTVSIEPGQHTLMWEASDLIGNSLHSNVQAWVDVVTVTAKPTKATVQQDLTKLRTSVNGLPASTFKPGTKIALLAALDVIQLQVKLNRYVPAATTLQTVVLPRMDGCSKTGTPDSNDWVRTCAAQNQLYPQVKNLIQELKAF